MSVIKRIPVEKIVAARNLLMSVNLDDMLVEILSTIEKTYKSKPWLLSGRSSAFLLSGLIYLTAKRKGMTLTQREIGKALIISELTVRNSTRFWMDLLGDEKF